MKKFINLLLTCSLLIALFVSLSKTNWFFELFTHYVVYYAVAGATLGLLSMALSRWKTALVFITLAAINTSIFAPYLHIKNVNDTTPTLTVLSQNFHFKNANFTEMQNLLDIENPDIFVIHEAGEQWRNVLGSFANNYPHMDITAETGIHGIVIGSRISGDFEEIPLGSKFGLLFTPSDQSFRVLAVHPFAPIAQSYAEERNDQFNDIENFVRESTVPTIVVGDFNSTPWSPHFQDLLERANLSDARLGFGLTPTWHAHNFLFELPIDFVLTTDKLETLDFHRTAKISSDHYGIFAAIKL